MKAQLNPYCIKDIINVIVVTVVVVLCMLERQKQYVT